MNRLHQGAVVLVAIFVMGAWVLARQTTANTLIGWAMLPAHTFAEGPTSGQFVAIGPLYRDFPLIGKQPVQGFSAVLAGPVPGTYFVLPDNGFGSQANSADALLRVYAVRPDFRTASGGTGTVAAAEIRSGAALQAFTPASFITLHDPDRRVGFPLVAGASAYPARQSTVAVAPEIRTARLLTGADFDPESFRVDKNGAFWFGDEFGPFLLKTDRTGKVLRPEVPLPGVFAPENPHRGTTPANLGSSRGFEGLAVTPTGDRLYGLVEGTVTGDPARTLRIHEFDVEAERYTGSSFLYRLEPDGTNIGDMTAIDAERFLIIERNGVSGTTGAVAPFKKIFLVDLGEEAADGALRKREVVDLMNLADPNDLNRDASAVFTFPFTTVEDLLVVDARTLLVINDNNYPAGGGRGPASDHTEFLLIQLANPLPAPTSR